MSARVAAAQARRELAFLKIAEEHTDKLLAAKAELADNPGDPAVVVRHRAAADEMHEFRAWARTVGKPKDGGPNDAMIRMGA